MYPVFWIKFYQESKKKKITLEFNRQDHSTRHSGFLFKLTMGFKQIKFQLM